MRYLLLLMICISCGNDNFPKVEKLEGFRILGVVSSQPEVAPGGSSNLQVIVSDVGGSAPVVNGSYVVCIDPGISTGAQASCDNPLAAGAYDLDFSTLQPNIDLRTGVNALVLPVTAPANMLAASSLREQNNGVALIVIFTFNLVGKSYSVFKRLIVTNRTPLNTNPVITEILSNSNSLTATPADGENLSLATSTPPEQYDYINVDGSLEARLEEYEVAWYSNVAEFSKPKASFDERTKVSLKSQGPAIFLAILRDGRGGITIAKETFP